VTVKKDKPLIANIMLDGILPSDLKVPESEEKGVPLKKKPTFPVSGRVTVGGAPVAEAFVALHTYDARRRPTPASRTARPTTSGGSRSRPTRSSMAHRPTITS